MPSPGQLVFAAVMTVLIVLVLALTIREIGHLRAATCALSRRHRLVRLAAGSLLLCLLGLVFFGGFAWMEPTAETVRVTLAYWARCSVLGYLVMLLAFADLSLVLRLRRQQRQERQQRQDVPAAPAEQVTADD